MPLLRTIQPFPATPFSDYPRENTLNDSVKQIGKKFPQLKIALIDLTRPSPVAGFPYGGINDDTNINIGSGAKVAAMYAAYQLQQAVIDVLSGLSPGSGDSGASLLSEVSRQLFPLSSAPYWGRFAQDVPQLANILDITPNPPSWNVNFISKPHVTLEPYHADGGNLSRVRNELGFWERLILMIVSSDNCAAMSCIQDLGFQYINGLLARMGFFDVTRNLGLWLGAAYGIPCTSTRTALWGQVPGGSFLNDQGFQVSTARMLAKFMATVAEGLAVNGAASGSMLGLMRKRVGVNGAPPTRSFLGAMLKAQGLVVCSKLGIGSFLSDMVIVERLSASGKTNIKYVAVALGASSSAAVGPAQLSALALELDNCIESRHP
jgi:Beta-lactamase enzyme family